MWYPHSVIKNVYSGQTEARGERRFLHHRYAELLLVVWSALKRDCRDAYWERAAQFPKEQLSSTIVICEQKLDYFTVDEKRMVAVSVIHGGIQLEFIKLDEDVN
ncbi:hypothetical protein QE152_g5504 [Popillia japonica]|uniref:Uncharacterized protein n=1 Tax=Popillia japonica TaxID=7064 RepID=A0AAW1MIE2_POPJA